MSTPKSSPDPELRSLVDLLPSRRSGRVRRGGQSPLSRDEVVRAAMKLADAEGLEATSMRRIATELDAGTMTLYGYVSDREALHAAMLDEALAEIELPGQRTGSWRADLELAARQLRGVCRRHPWLAQLLGNTPVLYAPRWIPTLEFSLAALEPFGLDVRHAAAIGRLVNNYVVGATLRETSEIPASGAADDPAYRAAVRAYLQQVESSGRYPTFGRLVREMLDGRDLTPDENFDIGLSCLLDGIEAQLSGA
ncbi:MAG TPA: TetR/AcrR family transcriptional regulator C-terminal domain-containing protein [Terriglobales bacterium]|nr:TetR/AcrR family transcriptional regulator C-terminal domain-containing protein [Terriglobales bacterium]